MMLPPGLLLAALTSAEAIATILNSAASTSPARFAEAKALVAREAKAGMPLQQFVMGVTTDDAALGKRYREAAHPKIFRLATEKGNPLAWYLLSLESNDLGQLRRAADGGNVQALNALGTIVTQEAVGAKEMATNKVEAVLRRSYGYFRQAAMQRDPNGFVNLGTCYLRGFGCEANYPMAFACFKAAAAMGHPEAMDYVSACYENGHGVPRDAAESLRWRMRGRAARGDAAAAEWLRKVK